MSDELKLEKVGDKVLMAVIGAGFSIPVYVQKTKAMPAEVDMWLVTCAIDLMQAQYDILWEILSTVSVRISHGRYAVIDDEEKLRMVAVPVHGVTPEYHYRWDNSPAPADGEIDVSDSEELPKTTFDNAFIHEVVARTRILTDSQMKVVWNAIVQVAVHWLLVKRKPINFGFMTVIALPYRANWKSILAKGFPNSYSCFTRSEDQIEPTMASMGLLDSLLMKELIEMEPKEHWANWRIEVIPNKLWTKTVRVLERNRLCGGKEAYAKFIANCIKRSRSWIIASYRHFVCRAVNPAAEFSPLAAPGSQILIPETRRGGLSKKALERSSGDICYSPAVDWKSPCLTSLVDEEIERMSQVPDLRSQAAELRISGGYVVRPKGT